MYLIITLPEPPFPPSKATLTPPPPPPLFVVPVFVVEGAGGVCPSPPVPQGLPNVRPLSDAAPAPPAYATGLPEILVDTPTPPVPGAGVPVAGDPAPPAPPPVAPCELDPGIFGGPLLTPLPPALP